MRGPNQFAYTQIVCEFFFILLPIHMSIGVVFLFDFPRIFYSPPIKIIKIITTKISGGRGDKTIITRNDTQCSDKPYSCDTPTNVGI